MLGVSPLAHRGMKPMPPFRKTETGREDVAALNGCLTKSATEDWVLGASPASRQRRAEP